MSIKTEQLKYLIDQSFILNLDNSTTFIGKRSHLHNCLDQVDKPMCNQLCDLTNGGSKRSNPQFRKEILETLIPHLPLVNSLHQINPSFLQRNNKVSENGIFNNYNVGDVYSISNFFSAFYLDGQTCGGISGTGDTVFITEDFKNAVYIGALSLHASEREVLIPQGTEYTIFSNP